MFDSIPGMDIVTIIIVWFAGNQIHIAHTDPDS